MDKSKQVFLKKWLTKNQGFSLVEVVAGIVIMTAFSLVALQAMTYSMLEQVKAERESRATNWIQSRVARVKLRASQLDLDPEGRTKPKESLCNASSKDGGYANKLKNRLVNSKKESQTKEVLGKEISLVRTVTPKDQEPYNILELQYEAKLENDNSDSNDNVIADFHTEVVPKESLACF